MPARGPEQPLRFASLRVGPRQSFTRLELARPDFSCRGLAGASTSFKSESLALSGPLVRLLQPWMQWGRGQAPLASPGTSPGFTCFAKLPGPSRSRLPVAASCCCLQVVSFALLRRGFTRLADSPCCKASLALLPGVIRLAPLHSPCPGQCCGRVSLTCTGRCLAPGSGQSCQGISQP